MMARLSSEFNPDQLAISSSERPQPMQNPELASISQISTQGVSMGNACELPPVMPDYLGTRRIDGNLVTQPSFRRICN